jgi:hypothetical protein
MGIFPDFKKLADKYIEDNHIEKSKDMYKKFGDYFKQKLQENENKIRSKIGDEIFDSIFHDNYVNNIVKHLENVTWPEFSLMNKEQFELWDFAWCIICCYKVFDSSCDDKTIISQFIKSKYYNRYSFINDNYHGPFNINKISVDNYRNIKYDEMKITINNIFNNGYSSDRPDEKQVNDINNKIGEIIQGATTIYYLDINYHDNYYNDDITEIDFFNDFIIINRKDNTLLNVCFGAD